MRRDETRRRVVSTRGKRGSIAPSMVKVYVDSASSHQASRRVVSHLRPMLRIVCVRTPHSHRTAADDPTHGTLGTHNAPHLHPITPDLYLLLAWPLIYRVSWRRETRGERER